VIIIVSRFRLDIVSLLFVWKFITRIQCSPQLPVDPLTKLPSTLSTRNSQVKQKLIVEKECARVEEHHRDEIISEERQK